MSKKPFTGLNLDDSIADQKSVQRLTELLLIAGKSIINTDLFHQIAHTLYNSAAILHAVSGALQIQHSEVLSGVESCESCQSLQVGKEQV